MPRSESRLDEDSPVSAFLRDMLRAGGAAVVRNPLVVASGTAFLVTIAYISGNALWNQREPHLGAFFNTRQMTHYAIVREDEVSNNVPEHAIADPVVEQVQRMLADMNLYAGSVDGRAGPQTRKAVEDYQRLAGTEVSGRIDQNLLSELRKLRETTPAPAERQAGREVAAVDPAARPAARPEAEPPVDIARIQAGLRAFGNADIEIDGIVGSRTRAAVREFQGLFGLPMTGEPDVAVAAKMREIGLTN